MKNPLTLEIKCPICSKISYLTVEKEDYIKYINGGLIQRIFPHNSLKDRELLITNLCFSCQDNIFEEDLD